MKVSEKEASALLKRKKDRYNGDVDRKVYAVVNFTITKAEVVIPKPKSTPEKKPNQSLTLAESFERTLLSLERPIVAQRLLFGKITSIDVYEFEGYPYNWIGTINLGDAPIAKKK